MAKDILTAGQLKADLIAELNSISGISIHLNESNVRDMRDYSTVSNGIHEALDHYVEQSIVRASQLFDESIADKKRQLELGELADKFFQRIKLNG